jgi:hypothetical protein
MPTTKQGPPIRFAQAEEGEIIGTVRQLSGRFNLPEPQVLPCLQTCGEDPVILRAGSGPSELLILDSAGADMLRQCGAGPAPLG